jgi:hypothetical protein
MLSAPSDDVVTELFECMWVTANQSYPWGFLEGDVSSFTFFTIAALPRSTGPAQVKALLPRLQTPEPFKQGNVIQMLLSAAIGRKGRWLESLNFLELPPFQAAGLRGIAEVLVATNIQQDQNLLAQLRSWGIPVQDLPTFTRWATGAVS